MLISIFPASGHTVCRVVSIFNIHCCVATLETERDVIEALDKIYRGCQVSSFRVVYANSNVTNRRCLTSFETANEMVFRC